jgi:Mn2+/Fe2+ NRAMP family transporter
MPEPASASESAANLQAGAADAAVLRSLEGQPLSQRLPVYVRMSGPGWLQSAITLGGGSLAGSLYLGVIGGFGLLWLQPMAMIMGIVMLSAIGYVTMVTRREALGSICEHVNPVLGYGWAVASLLASMVWAMPQYSLSIGVLQQNLLPGLLGAEGTLGNFWGKLLPTLLIVVFSTYITWNYSKGGRGVKLYETTLKITVGLIVLCFTGVVLRVTFSPAGLDWGAVLAGFIPDLGILTKPAEGFQPLIAATAPAHHAYWTDFLVNKQRDIIVTAAATAVGINMTFLFPYSILRRGWGKEFSGLLKFDLGTGMLIPFTLATSFVVIAAASQFHTVAQPGIPAQLDGGIVAKASAGQLREYEGLLAGLEKAAGAEVGVTDADRRLAATLVNRDAYDLAKALEPLTGPFFGRIIFGIGVLGMTLSTITILMLISGQVVCAIFKQPQTGWLFRLGSLAAVSGALGPFIWGQASFYLAVPTSIFGLILLPIAYLSFALLLNQKKLLGDAMPTGGSRVVWNVLMGITVAVVASASVFMIQAKGGVIGMSAAGAFVLAAIVAHFMRRPRTD